MVLFFISTHKKKIACDICFQLGFHPDEFLNNRYKRDIKHDHLKPNKNNE